MTSRDACGDKVVKAHDSGDLHVHGLDEGRGLWASWDPTRIGSINERSDLATMLKRLAAFSVKAGEEWYGHQSFTKFESLASKSMDLKERDVREFLRLLSGKSNRVFLGLEEQDRDDENVKQFDEALFRSLDSEPGLTQVVPLVVFGDYYEWGSDTDLAIFESTATINSPVFIHRKATAERVDPWLDDLEQGATGVLGAVTLNLPRASHNSGDEDDFFDNLGEILELAIGGLEDMRTYLEKKLKAGGMPATASVIDDFDDFFCAIGVVGVHEALLNLNGKGIDSLQGKAVAYRILEEIRRRLKEREEGTGHRFCVTAEPSDGVSYRFAELDQAKYPEMVTSGVGTPIYTRSTCLPVDYSDDLWDTMEHQKKLQTLYSGGTILNLPLGERIANAGECKMLVRRIVERTQLPCFSISPTVNVESRGGKERYERLGYWYAPVSGMGAGEMEEVRLRRPYAVASGW